MAAAVAAPARRRRRRDERSLGARLRKSARRRLGGQEGRSAEREEPAEKEAEALVAWLLEKGAHVEGVRIAFDGGAGRRLVAARPLPSGFTFLRLPERCALTPTACAASPLGRRIQERHRLVVPEDLSVSQLTEALEAGESCVTYRTVLYAFLLAAPEDDSFGPFLRHLRRKLESPGGTPHIWSEADRARLPSSVASDLREYEAHVLGQHQAMFPGLCEAFPQDFPSAACSEARWRRAHSLVTSNAFPGEGPEGDADGVLLPLLDCMNHDCEATNVQWLGLGLGEGLGARVTRPVLEGEELLYSYGLKGNAALTLGYGFAVWDNPNETLPLRLQLPSSLRPASRAWNAAARELQRAVAEACRDDRTSAELLAPGSATFRLALEDLEQGTLPSGLRRAAAAVGGAGALRRLLLEAGEALMRRREGDGSEAMTGGAWGRYERAVRRRDSVKVGSQCCACTPQGCAVAIRSSQLQVLAAALDLLAEEPADGGAERQAGGILSCLCACRRRREGRQ